MDARTFLDTYGTAEAERVAKAAGTNLAYFRQIAYGNRTPSPKLAKALQQKSDAHMTVLELLFPSCKEHTPKRAGNGGS